MNKAFLLLIILLVSTELFAKEVFQRGSLILNTGDTINCEIKVFKPYVFISSNKIEYRLKDDETNKISYKEISKILFDSLTYERIDYTWTGMAYRGPNLVKIKQTDQYFAAIIISGKFILYKHYFMSQSGGVYTAGSTYLEHSYYIKNNNTLSKINKITFKKDCRDLFESCPQLLKDIEDGNYNYQSIEELVRKANNSCNE